MKVLVACEFSGTVRNAFRRRGHDAWSCDLLPADDGSEYHIQGDCREHLEGWDMVIAHPPCTYLSKAGARFMFPVAGEVDAERLKKAKEAVEFFHICLNANAEFIAVENPTPLKICGLPPHNATVQPYEYGHPYSKRTLLWLKNLPPLMPTKILSQHKPLMPSNTGGKKRGHKATPSSVTWAESVKTYEGIAEAMAEQWGNL
jgi:hypothetical protein